MVMTQLKGILNGMMFIWSTKVKKLIRCFMSNINKQIENAFQKSLAIYESDKILFKITDS